VANADDGQATADQTAAMIAAVAPATLVVPDAATLTAAVSGEIVQLPSSAGGVVTVSHGPEASADDQALPVVTVSLPHEVQAKQGQRAQDGTVVYASSGPADAAVQVLADQSVRLETVVKSGKRQQKFTYTFTGAVPQLQKDGSVNLVATKDSGSVKAQAIVAQIAPAWAVDAKGKPVSTSYRVTKKGELVQKVKPGKNAAYPIVTDPQVSVRWFGAEFYLNKNETNNAGYGAALYGIIGGAALFWVPPAAAAVAAVGGAYAATAAWAQGAGMCLKITWTPVLIYPSRYSGGNCR